MPYAGSSRRRERRQGSAAARWLGFCVAASLGWGCRSAGVARPDPQVSWHGSLRAMMREGRTAAAVSLGELLPDPHLYAVGALEGLAGEITVIAGDVWISMPGDGPGGVVTERGARSGRGAALLVEARVHAWDERRTERELQLEDLADLALGGRTSGSAVVFMLDGRARIEGHVVDGRKIEPGTDHAAHRQAGVRVEAKGEPVLAVGFASRSHQGVFTHHGESVHVHAVLPERGLTFHVDSMHLEPGARLRLPARGPR
jgi:acetolactate decarboxylase